MKKTIPAMFAIFATAHASVADSPRTMHTPVVSLITTQALNLVNGPYGTSFNGQTYQQEAIVSHKGWQYATFYEDGGNLCVARRKLPDGDWKVLRFDDYAVKHNDVHNVPVIGICAKDGTIHLSYDHHCSQLHYRRSVAGLADEPEKFAWRREDFGVTTDALVPGEPMRGVTYPGFIAVPDGRLQLLYRTGSSGNGDWHLAEYDGAEGWCQLGILLSRQGDYDTSKSRCAYPNPLRYDAQGRLATTWCWRERPANGITDLRTNHDIGYAYSDDFGRTWRNNAGDRLTLPIAVDSPGIVVRETKFLWGQMNTTTQFTDAKSRVHVVNWQMEQTAPAGSKNMNPWRYYHYWRDEAGVWHTNLLPFTGRKPQIVLNANGDALLIHTRADNKNYHGTDPGGTLTIARATEASGWTDWQTVWEDTALSVGEPLYDAGRFAREGILTVYTQAAPAAPGTPSALRAIDFR